MRAKLERGARNPGTRSGDQHSGAEQATHPDDRHSGAVAMSGVSSKSKARPKSTPWPMPELEPHADGNKSNDATLSPTELASEPENHPTLSPTEPASDSENYPDANVAVFEQQRRDREEAVEAAGDSVEMRPARGLENFTADHLEWLYSWRGDRSYDTYDQGLSVRVKKHR